MSAVDPLRPYVAGIVVDWLKRTPEQRHRSIEGTLAFVDISGFTTLTEKLARRGKVGAEEMTDILDSTFAALLEVAYSHGAMLVKWGGDAVLLLFQGDDHEALAARAAYEMRATMRSVGRLKTSMGAVTLRMSVGINSGVFDFFVVGERHHELLAAGPAASMTAILEGEAEAGEILLGPVTAGALEGRCLGEPKGQGVLLRSAPTVAPRCRYWPRLSEPFPFGRCLDSVLAEQVRADVGEGEHRQVGVGFVEVSGVDAVLAQLGGPATGDALHALMTVVQSSCARHHVTFWETDISRDGFKVMVVAGAPNSSGHDEAGLLRATRSILDSIDSTFSVRIGTNCGRVFSGAFGPAFRRTFSAKGDAVNVAARVMAKAAPGALLATDALLGRAHLAFETTPLEPFMVKGKSQLMHASVVGVLATPDHTSDDGPPMIGRNAELDMLDRSVRAALEGRGSAVAVVGDAGVGKSRLLARLEATLPDGVRCCRTYCDDVESSTPFFVFWRLLRELLGCEPDEVGPVLERVVNDSALEPWLPLLALPFGVELPDTPQTQAVRPRFRRQRLGGLLAELLDRIAVGPLVLVVEDAHLADDASLDLLERLARAARERSWLLVLTARDGMRLPRDASVVELGPLSEAESRRLVLAAAESAPLTARAMASVCARGEGNPLFLLELVGAARRAGDGGELPTTLEEVLAAQVDILSPTDRSLLRAAAAVGVTFQEELVAAIVEPAPSAEDLRRLGRFLAPDGAGSWRFRTTLVRDVAYEGLSFRRRVALHSRVADELQQAAGEGRGDFAEQLSWQYFAAQRFAEAWENSRVAGARAQRMYANSEALAFYQRALQCARRLDEVPALEVATVAESLGDAHARLAELEDASAAYANARRRVPKESHEVLARLAVSTGLVAARAGSTARARRWLSRAASLLADDDDAHGSVGELRARVLVELAYLRHSEGGQGDAARLGREALACAEAVGADGVTGRALHLLDLVDLARGGTGDVERVHRALALFESTGDLPRQAGVWNHLGVRAYYAGAWDEAIRNYQQARNLHARAGDEWSAAIASANIGEILVDQGRLADALPLVTEALAMWRASGTPSDIGFGAALLGRLALRDGRFDDGYALLSEAAAGYGSMDERFDLLDTDLRVVEGHLLQGRGAAAVAALNELAPRLVAALRAAGVTIDVRAEKVGWSLPPRAPQTANVLRLQGYALAQTGDADSAHRAMTDSRASARERGATHDLALALDGLAWLGDETVLVQRDALFTQLGIVWSPEVPTATNVVRPRRASEPAVD